MMTGPSELRERLPNRSQPCARQRAAEGAMGAGPAPIGRQSPVFRRKWAEGRSRHRVAIGGPGGAGGPTQRKRSPAAKRGASAAGTRRRREGAAPPLKEASMMSDDPVTTCAWGCPLNPSQFLLIPLNPASITSKALLTVRRRQSHNARDGRWWAGRPPPGADLVAVAVRRTSSPPTCRGSHAPENRPAAVVGSSPRVARRSLTPGLSPNRR